MLAASLIIGTILSWLAFNALADALDHIDQETAKADSLAPADCGGSEAAAVNLAGGGHDSSRLTGSHDIAHREQGSSK